MEFVDFKSLKKSTNIDIIFPEWQKNETVAFLSPHDDDVILGAAYLLGATLKNKGIPLILIFCSGDAGYSSPEEKDTITQRRKEETLKAYEKLGVSEERIIFFNIPDFSLMPYINRTLPQGKGLFEEQVKLFRKEKVSRVLFTSGHFEHWDHTAVFNMGIYNSPHAGDPVLADIGAPYRTRSYYAYSVWADFEPPKSELYPLRADIGILVEDEEEEKVRDAIREFSSQRKIFKDIVAYREKRKSDSGYLELYKKVDTRKQIDFKAYFALLNKCKQE